MSESTATTAPNPTRELFKYRAINEYTLAFLSTGAVYFSSPEDFNDPFDTHFVERDDLRAQLQRFVDDRQAMGTDAAMVGVGAMLAFVREHRTGGVKTRIYCASEIVDSILMWSHYTDSHRGICVVLEAQQIGAYWWVPFAGRSVSLAEMKTVKTAADGRIEIFDSNPPPSDPVMVPAQQVLYRDQVPDMFMFDPPSSGPVRGVTFELVKHTSWAYERERRVIVRESFLVENPAYLFSDTIVGVVFGMKISKADALRVRAAIDLCARTRPISYSRMIARSDGFALDRVLVPDIDEFIRSLA